MILDLVAENLVAGTEKNCDYAGIHPEFLPVFLFLKALRDPGDYVVLLETDSDASSFYEIIRELALSVESSVFQNAFGFSPSRLGIFYFPGWGMMPFHYLKPDKTLEAERSRTLSSLNSSGFSRQIVVASLPGFILRVPDKDKLTSKILKLDNGQSIPRPEILTYLESMGYVRSDIVEIPGEYSLKGGILDVFCPSYENPVRLEFFGDEIDTIRFFNVYNQLSIEKIKEIKIFPRRDIYLSSEEIKALVSMAKKSPELEIPAFLKNPGSSPQGLWDVFALVQNTVPFADYLPNSYCLVVPDKEGILKKTRILMEEVNLFYEKSHGILRAPVEKMFLTESEMERILDRSHVMGLLSPSKDAIRVPVREQKKFKGKVTDFLDYCDDVEMLKRKKYFTSANSAQLERMQHIFENNTTSNGDKSILLFPSGLRGGFSSKNTDVFTDMDIFGKKTHFRKIQKTNTEIIESYLDINEGDYIVHINYGVGRFAGIKRMKAGGYERDFLILAYADEDKLYVPLEQLKYVHRYIGSVDNIRLDYLGKKSSWEKTRKKVSENIEKLAEELLDIYAERENARGFSFKPDNIFQEEFEASFPYEETDHQIMAIHEVKKDMESPKPMDRLVCGDVGFGKTEVAIRAAFKAVMSGKQVAFLCPTTVLTLQHYNTFSARLKEFSVNTDFVSRFKTPMEIKKTLEQIKEGNVDIIIGTHALLSEKIEYKDLGLLVIDEEQRFGVKQKEQIKKMKNNVDCLTLTATPIPRTLHLSLAGLRDLSLIETPPGNRRKIETYVTEENDDLLREAIRNELNRRGQIYILHNKVMTIDLVASRIRSLYPAASLNVLHGQMDDDQIEEILVQFYNHQFDILLTTTIIESGIDIPNVNTLVVLNADAFGLSQLYQLKGRVGRSDRVAHAYFFYSPQKAISEISQKRLNTIQEYDDLGSGFRIALRDMEIRGAGNILGREQSGDIMNVGFEMYLDMLNEKLSVMQNKPLENYEANIVIPHDYYIPDTMVTDTRQKMEIYKKMSRCKTRVDLESLKKEMEDRFGRLDELMENIFFLEMIRVLSGEARFDRVEKKEDVYMVTVSPETKMNLKVFQELLQSDPRIRLYPEDPRIFSIKPYNRKNELRELSSILEYLL